MRGAGFDERDEVRRPYMHSELESAADRHPGNRVEGEQRRVLSRPVHVDLHAVDVEDAAADPVVAPGIGFIAIVTEAEAPPFRLFLG
jgi:hypothetical protein